MKKLVLLSTVLSLCTLTAYADTTNSQNPENILKQSSPEQAQTKSKQDNDQSRAIIETREVIDTNQISEPTQQPASEINTINSDKL